MEALAMELRDVNESERLIVGVVAPYDEVSYLTPDPNGERIRRGAFARTIAHRAAKIPLFRNHDHDVRYGTSRTFREDGGGLIGEFVVNEGEAGDDFLADCRHGYYGGMSAAWVPKDVRRGTDGVREIVEAMLMEVSTVGMAAYEGAGMLAVRQALPADELVAAFGARPEVNLAPIPPLVYRPR